jgi:radical SAM superfamily enzyme YgiQ (UPF0313 family)
MIMLGLESGDEELRRTVLNRHYSNDQIYRAASLLRHSGLPFFTYNIFGFPFESRDQMKRTVEINRSVRPCAGQVSFFYPYPGTILHKMCKDNDLLISERMDEVSGYFEQPVIKFPRCSLKDCVKLKNRLLLYMATRRLSGILRIDNRFVDWIVFGFLMTAPALFALLFTRESKFKQFFRKLQYLRMRRQAL